ncbi:copia protein [Tanacetum coccineum]
MEAGTTSTTLSEVILNGNKVLKRTVGETKPEYEPTTAKEKQDRRNEMKARGTLLMALPNKDQLNLEIHLEDRQEVRFKLRDNALVENKKKLEKAEKERDELKLTLEKFQNSSKSLNNLLESQVIDKFKNGLGYNAASSTAASPVVESFKVWTLVDLPNGKRAIGTKWVFRNKKDKRGIVIRNKARLVAQGYTQEEGIDYDEVFAPVARIEAIRLFFAHASYMGFIVYQMDMKSSFLYGTIEEERADMRPCLTTFIEMDLEVALDKTLFINEGIKFDAQEISDEFYGRNLLSS